MVFVFSCGISMVTYMADVERLWGKKIKKKYQQIFTRFHCHSDLHQKFSVFSLSTEKSTSDLKYSSR